MDGIAETLLTLAVLCASVGLGVALQPRLSEHHRSRASVEVIWLVVGMIVTFAAIVLGLLITTQKASFDTSHHDRSTFAADLVQLDQCLRDYGPEADPIRRLMITYTAASIAATWPDENSPDILAKLDLSNLPHTGESLALGNILNDAEMAIRRLHPTDSLKQSLIGDCLRQFDELTRQRWRMIAETPGLSRPFYVVLLFWLAVIFTSFGLFAPRNLLVMTAIGMCAVCLSLAMLTLMELNSPYSGLIRVPSDAMRNALAHMTRD